VYRQTCFSFALALEKSCHYTKKKSMDRLSKELLGSVLRFLPPTDLLQSVPLVSKEFHRVVDDDHFWLSTCKHPPDKAFLTRHQVQRSELFDYYRSIQQEIIPRFLSHGNILVPRATATQLRRGGTRRACVASSTDHVQEQLENCLMDETDESLAAAAAAAAADQNGAGDADDDFDGTMLNHPLWIRWWSSAPATSDQTSDTLLFSFRYPLASLSAMHLKPLRDPYYPNGPVYTWRKTILRVYNIPAEQLQLGNIVVPPFASSAAPCSFPVAPDTTPVDLRGHRIINVMGGLVMENSPIAPSDRPTCDAVLKDQTPVYEKEHDVPLKCGGILSYTLPVGVIGNAIAVELVGKRFEQRRGAGYFACVQRVECVGIPLDAVMDDDDEDTAM
jgi:F-box domain